MTDGEKAAMDVAFNEWLSKIDLDGRILAVDQIRVATLAWVRAWHASKVYHDGARATG
jgi:hypothetical protein